MIFGFNRQDIRIIWNFFRANIRDKYLGTSLGSLWGIASPLMMLLTFTFVFGYVYKVKLGVEDTSPLGYAIWLISGYGPWLAISESIMASATSITGAAGIVKNLAIKTEVLPVASALTGMLPLAVSLIFLLILLIANGQPPTWHALYLIPIVFLQAMLVVAIGFLIATITVFFRDIAYALPNILLALLFATPIFYPIDSMPGVMKPISELNPFYILTNAYRDCLVSGMTPDLLGLLYVGLISIFIGYLTLHLFRRAKGYFEAAL